VFGRQVKPAVPPDDDVDAFDDGLVERLEDVGTYVSPAPQAVSANAFRHDFAGDLSLTERLAVAVAERRRLGLDNPITGSDDLVDS